MVCVQTGDKADGARLSGARNATCNSKHPVVLFLCGAPQERYEHTWLLASQGSSSGEDGGLQGSGLCLQLAGSPASEASDEIQQADGSAQVAHDPSHQMLVCVWEQKGIWDEGVAWQSQSNSAYNLSCTYTSTLINVLSFSTTKA